MMKSVSPKKKAAQRRFFLIGSIGVLFIVGAVSLVVPQVRLSVIKTLSYSQCDTPVLYKLGALDFKFNLTEKSALAGMQSGADIWNKSYGKLLFRIAPEATLTINFVYDQRSALRAKIGTLQNQLDRNNTTLDQQINSYEADVSVFEKKLANYKARVTLVNQSGGAPPDEYDALVAEQKDLNAEGDALNVRAKQLSLGTRTYNANVDILNDNVSQFNENLILKPEEGLYSVDDNTITIYFAENRQELIHTLAHEFGHVLELTHTDDQSDIMYPSVSSTLSLSTKDAEQLTYICREQLLPLRWFQMYRDWIHSAIRFLSDYTPAF